MTFLDADARGPGDGLEQLPLLRNHEGANRTVAVVQLGRGRDEDTAPGERGIRRPAPPALEKGPQARQAARLLERRRHHLFHEPLGGDAQHLELQLLLGGEMGEEAALRESELRGQRRKAQPFQTVAGREAEGGVEDFAILKIVRPVVLEWQAKKHDRSFFARTSPGPRRRRRRGRGSGPPSPERRIVRPSSGLRRTACRSAGLPPPS